MNGGQISLPWQANQEKIMVKKAFVFPGQGSQYIGMGKKLCENFKIASDTFDEASEALSMDIKKMCLEGDQAELTLTHNAQPAILTLSTAMFKVCMKEEGIQPDLMAGHSLGEISALTCAGAIQFSDAVNIVRKRGEFMQHAVSPERGSMMAILCRDVEKIENICKLISNESSMACISNFNSRTQLVISGDQKAIDEAVNILSEEKIKVNKLNVSAPFHSPLMQPAADQLREELEKYTFNDPIYPVLSNVTAKPYQGREDIINNLTSQIVMPVQWVQSMIYLKKAMVLYGVELGPGNVLRNMMKSNISDIRIFSYDNNADVEKLKKHIKNSYTPFLSRSMGIAVATKNLNWNNEEYKKGVIEQYNKINEIQKMVEKDGREANMDEMKQAVDMLLCVFKTKKTSHDEQISRFKELFCDTGTETIFKDFDYSVIV